MGKGLAEILRIHSLKTKCGKQCSVGFFPCADRHMASETLQQCPETFPDSAPTDYKGRGVTERCFQQRRSDLQSAFSSDHGVFCKILRILEQVDDAVFFQCTVPKIPTNNGNIRRKLFKYSFRIGTVAQVSVGPKTGYIQQKMGYFWCRMIHNRHLSCRKKLHGIFHSLGAACGINEHIFHFITPLCQNMPKGEHWCLIFQMDSV